MKYEILHFTLCDGWVNTWSITNEDGTSEPEYFETKEQAIHALTEFLDDEREDYEKGNIESPYDIEEFKIMPVMDKEKMIELLVNDDFNSIMNCENTDLLDSYLKFGHKGYRDYTLLELTKECSERNLWEES